MAANSNRQKGAAPSSLTKVAVVPLGGMEPPATLLRALAALELTVALKPTLEDLLEAPLVVFAGRDALVADAVTTLRASRGALRPVLAIVDGAASPWLDASWSCIADSVLRADASPAAFTGAIEPLTRIAAAVAGLPAEDLACNDAERRRIRALRWMATRQTASLVPTRAAASRSLHRYGALEAICGANLDEDLGALSKSGYLRAEHADRIYRCACGDARLHFRDACEHCGKSALEVAHVLRHHCGHAASSADFWRGEELACPACGEELKVAGQDYEGPIDRTRCRACEKLSSEGLTLATCTGCGTSTSAENLVADAVLRYTLTDAGRVALLAETAPAPADAIQKRAALLAAWKKICSAPAMAGRPKPVASLVQCTGFASKDLDATLGATLRASDLAVRLGANGFVALLADTPREGAQRFAERMSAAEHRNSSAGNGADRDGALPPVMQVLVHPEQTAEIDAALAALPEN